MDGDDPTAPPEGPNDPVRPDHSDQRARVLRPPDELELKRWWKAYCDLPEPKSPARLAHTVRASIHRVRQAIRVGWPFDNITAFSKRGVPIEAKRTHKESLEAVGEAIETITASMSLTWEAAARPHLASLQDVSETIKRVAYELKIASQEATFWSWRRVPELDAEGRQILGGDGKGLYKYEKHVNGEAIARATARLAMAAKDHAILHKALLDSLNPLRDAAFDLSDAPPEALEYIRKKFG